ncbi:hypothetical protein TNCV_2729371 [Trichonephila clavipes]|nr:hypothetical protein TNCV_2729371 [Trichonephila clavipes]
MLQLRVIVQRNKEFIESFYYNRCSKLRPKVIQKSSHGVPYVLEDSWHATYPPSPTETDTRAMRSSNEGKAGQQK